MLIVNLFLDIQPGLSDFDFRISFDLNNIILDSCVDSKLVCKKNKKKNIQNYIVLKINFGPLNEKTI